MLTKVLKPLYELPMSSAAERTSVNACAANMVENLNNPIKRRAKVAELFQIRGILRLVKIILMKICEECGRLEKSIPMYVKHTIKKIRKPIKHNK